MQLGPAAYLLKSESISKIADTIRKTMQEKRKITSRNLANPPAKLTQAEHELLRLLDRGMKYQTIAETRNTSPETIRKQCESIILKLGLSNREELIAWAARSGYDAVDV